MACDNLVPNRNTIMTVAVVNVVMESPYGKSRCVK